MLTNETKQQFIILRAQGLGLCKIADQLRISSSTAYKWASRFDDEIAQLRAIEIEAIRERLLPNYEQELAYLADELKRVQTEIRARDYGYVKIENLHRYQRALFARIDKKCPPLRPRPAKDSSSADEIE
jgi:transposase